MSRLRSCSIYGALILAGSILACGPKTTKYPPPGPGPLSEDVVPIDDPDLYGHCRVKYPSVDVDSSKEEVVWKVTGKKKFTIHFFSDTPKTGHDPNCIPGVGTPFLDANRKPKYDFHPGPGSDEHSGKPVPPSDPKKPQCYEYIVSDGPVTCADPNVIVR
jgi:hypothetical protein